MKYEEFRGVSDLVIAEVTTDDDTAYETGEVEELAGAGEISKTTEASSATKYYDNIPAIVINAEGADTITVTSSVPLLATLAKITGKTIDEATGAMIDSEGKPKYFALGYKFQKTDGTDRYVWRLKGTFSVPDESSKTKDNGTDSSGMTLTYTGISTTHKFTKGNSPAKAVVVDDNAESKCDVSAFFETVTDPDKLRTKGVQSMAAKAAVKTTAKTSK